MKFRTFNATAAVIAVFSLIASNASADEPLPESEIVPKSEIVSGEQVSGDTLADTTVTNSGTYVGDVSTGSQTYVGDYQGGMIVQRTYGRPDLFYNYYTQGFANRVNAQMYLSPVPVPPNVGHTFYTYQPFHPHHLLYPHKNRFHRPYDNGRGMNRTRATYSTSPIRKSASNFYWNVLRIPR